MKNIFKCLFIYGVLVCTAIVQQMKINYSKCREKEKNVVLFASVE